MRIDQNAENTLRNGVNVAAIGHGDGIRQTIDSGGTVRDTSVTGDANVFESAVDTFHGHSGAPIIDMRDYTVVGILRNGEDDYEYDSASKCWRIATFSNSGGDGEMSVYVSKLARFRDASEPNDSLSAALSSPVQLRPDNNALKLVFSSNNHRVDTNDDDFFAFAVYPGDRATINIRFSHSRGDLELTLYDHDGRQIAESRSVSNDETVSVTVPRNVHGLVARVWGFRGAVNTYTIDAEIVPEATDYDVDGTLDPAEICGGTPGLGCSGGMVCNPRPHATWLQTEGATFDLSDAPGVCEPSASGGCHEVLLRLGTDHDYSSNTDESWTIAFPGNPGSVLWYIRRLETENYWDYLELLSGIRETGTQGPRMVADITRSQRVGFFDRATIDARFHSDGTVTDWGFELNSVYWCE